MRVFAALAALLWAGPAMAQTASQPVDYASASNWLCRPDAEAACTTGLDAVAVGADGSRTPVSFPPAAEAPIGLLLRLSDGLPRAGRLCRHGGLAGAGLDGAAPGGAPNHPLQAVRADLPPAHRRRVGPRPVRGQGSRLGRPLPRRSGGLALVSGPRQPRARRGPGRPQPGDHPAPAADRRGDRRPPGAEARRQRLPGGRSGSGGAGGRAGRRGVQGHAPVPVGGGGRLRLRLGGLPGRRRACARSAVRP